jgi:hypothetical protein
MLLLILKTSPYPRQCNSNKKMEKNWMHVRHLPHVRPLSSNIHFVFLSCPRSVDTYEVTFHNLRALSFWRHTAGSEHHRLLPASSRNWKQWRRKGVFLWSNIMYRSQLCYSSKGHFEFKWIKQYPCTMGTGSFPGVKSGRGVTLTPHPFLVPFVMKE